VALAGAADPKAAHEAEKAASREGMQRIRAQRREAAANARLLAGGPDGDNDDAKPIDPWAIFTRAQSIRDAVAWLAEEIGADGELLVEHIIGNNVDVVEKIETIENLFRLIRERTSQSEVHGIRDIAKETAEW
jgi:hypothetical protein